MARKAKAKSAAGGRNAVKAAPKTSSAAGAGAKASTGATSRTGGISDEAVRKATGKTWVQWLKLLDSAGCKKLGHKEIVAVISERCPEIGGWWTQMVTVGYEQARGLRQKHEKPEGFEIGASKTINVRIGKAFEAWTNERTRAKWLDEPIEIRKATKDKSVRITWSDGKTHVEVNFWDKGPAKCQVAVQHRKLKNAKDAEAKKNFWAARLVELKDVLEG